MTRLELLLECIAGVLFMIALFGFGWFILVAFG